MRYFLVHKSIKNDWQMKNTVWQCLKLIILILSKSSYVEVHKRMIRDIYVEIII